MRQVGSDIARWVQRLISEEEGQTATEYVMVISVMVIAMIAATSAFSDRNGVFNDTFRKLSRSIGGIVASKDSPLLPGP